MRLTAASSNIWSNTLGRLMTENTLVQLQDLKTWEEFERNIWLLRAHNRAKCTSLARQTNFEAMIGNKLISVLHMENCDAL